MIRPVLTQLAKRNISLLFAIFLMANGLLSQVSYTCHFDNALQAGTVAFRITVNSGSSEETWTVSNVANLYSNIDPDILVTDGHVIPEDPFNPGKYRLTGYAYDGVMPFATVMNNDIPVLDMNMITCMSPSADIMGDMEVCMGATAQFSASISNPNLLPNKINWSTNGSTTFENVYG
ncbi:MAG: hypothetical protein HKO89_01085, partial [Saprospiraceae bacterium]|nr:hypothetical protein [Saprospiraceae bacterium]